MAPSQATLPARPNSHCRAGNGFSHSAWSALKPKHLIRVSATRLEGSPVPRKSWENHQSYSRERVPSFRHVTALYSQLQSRRRVKQWIAGERQGIMSDTPKFEVIDRRKIKAEEENETSHAEASASATPVEQPAASGGPRLVVNDSPRETAAKEAAPEPTSAAQETELPPPPTAE